MDENLLNKIISAAYNDCGIVEKLKILMLTRKNPEAAKVYRSYKKTAQEVHSLSVDLCPEDIPWRAEARLQLPVKADHHFLKPAAAFTVIIIAAVVAMFSVMNNENKQTYTAAEVRTAEVQAKKSLLFVSRILNRTTNTLEKDILQEKVSKPVQKGLNIINNLFIGG